MENSNIFIKKCCNNSKDISICKRISQTKLNTSSKKLILEIFQKHPAKVEHPKSLQKVLVSIEPRSSGIKTLYFAEKTKHSRETEDNQDRKSNGKYHANDYELMNKKRNNKRLFDDSSATVSKVKNFKTNLNCLKPIKTNDEKEKCNNLNQKYTSTGPIIADEGNSFEKSSISKVKKVGDILYTNTIIDKAENTQNNTAKIYKKINHIESKLLKQEMVYRCMNSEVSISSSDEAVNQNDKNISTSSDPPGCSCIEYSQVPETSAFKYSQQSPSSSLNKGAILDKKHNSEQYSRDFTTYDGITARGRRQCASMTYKRESRPRDAADRVQKIRHKLAPVRDYRLMDTVHYLAQGEFAPRDDGIKLTSSREAVLSDIIWEDVCRTHWPNARIGRRGPDRTSTRYELQRLIDSLLRERVAHIERRRRRHYRIIKLSNNRHESCRPVGKTGDIIVASQKPKDMKENRQVPLSNRNATNVLLKERLDEQGRKTYRSCERLSPDRRHWQKVEDCLPGPSCALESRLVQPPCYFQTEKTLQKPEKPQILQKSHGHQTLEPSNACCNSSRNYHKNPKLIIKKDSRRKYHSKEDDDIKHLILLPALVIQTPSNVRRQKTFSSLYQRVLNKVQRSGVLKDPNSKAEAEAVKRAPQTCMESESGGYNIDADCSKSSQNLN